MTTTPLFSPAELKLRLPLSSNQLHFIHANRHTIQSILKGEDPRLLLILGPCSIHDLGAAREYAHLLKNLSRELRSPFFIVMRTYFEKPRTALGWKGYLTDPFLDGSCQIATGLQNTRQFLMEMADLEMPVGCEFLDPHYAPYFDDLISWGCIGARTATSPTHRQMASCLPMPIGIKNTTDGNIANALNGVLIASIPHIHLGMNPSGNLALLQTPGNQDAHVVLRGGEKGPNYDRDILEQTAQELEKNGLVPRLLVDCSHDNSGKNCAQQVHVFQTLIHEVIEGNTQIAGLMLESFIYHGNQPITIDKSLLKKGISITDPCLDWNTTSQLLQWASSKLCTPISSRSSQPRS